MIRIPHRGLKTRWVAILCGIAIFLWMGPEDLNVWPVVMLSVLVSILLVSVQLMRRYGGTMLSRNQIFTFAVVGGGICGLLTSPIAAALMILKNARHAHLTPDYLPQQMLAIMQRAPLWAISGSLIALGIALIWITFGPASMNPAGTPDRK